MLTFLQEAAHVRPSQRQLDWFALESYAFIHFSPNTYTDLEWGNGDEPESIFNPTGLDCDQWVAAIKSAGLKGMVLTAKHHDGFCLWPSRYTEHSVKNSPFRGDVVKEAADACRRGGIKFGFYLSPWDRNSQYYGSPEYNDYFCNQLTELLTGYGEIFCVWFDNACGEGPNGIKQVYDFPRYFDLIRQYQPHAVIFNDEGPDTRWCGNEAGQPRHAEWSVVPSELCHYADIQTGPGPLAEAGSLSYLYNSDDAIGDLSHILFSKGLVYVPAEIDMSIRPGWFWHENEEPHSLDRLFQTYIASVGNNACLNLNIPPTREGLLDQRDVQRLKEFGERLKQAFGQPLEATIEKDPESPPRQPKYVVTFAQAQKEVQYIVLAEDISQGQRVESFRITRADSNIASYEGTCIGHKKICQLQNPYTNQNPLTAQGMEGITRLTIHITAARDDVMMKDILIYS